MNQQNIEQAIVALENHRAELGNNVVDTSLAVLQQHLDGTSHSPLAGSALRGERKQVTVMFADISGFTAMSEKLDPEEVRSMINACFERLGAVIDRFGGHIDKFIGDEIMALFGAPVAHENDPERALRAALEMMDTLDQFNQEYAGQLPRPLSLHFGINTGLAIAGGIGTRQRQDYSVMGDTVNLAARLEDLSESGEILVGKNTYRLAAPLFEFEALNPVHVKGKSGPVQVFRLLGAKAIAGGQIRGIEGLHSPLVGRTVEMTALKEMMQRFFQGQGSVVSIIGEAGLGKSRLVTELQTACAQSGDDACWANGRALSHADSASYLVARDTLRHTLGIGMRALPTEATEKLRVEIEQVLPNQQAEIFPYLGYLLDVALDDNARQRIKYLSGQVLHQRILQAAQDFIVSKSRQIPLALVWEDLHWADPSSLELLETLLPLTRQQPLLLILVYRQPIKGSKIWHFHQDVCRNFANDNIHQTVDLPPLTPAESHQLLQNLLGVDALPQHVREMIVNKAEGNPFYMEEVIRSLIDSGSLTRTDDRWSAAANLAQISLPDSLQGVIMARIDQLDPQTKRVLQVASVIGRDFSFDLLARVMRNEK